MLRRVLASHATIPAAHVGGALLLFALAMPVVRAGWMLLLASAGIAPAPSVAAWMWWEILLIQVVAAPLFEEFLFRRVLTGALLRRMDARKAIVLGAIVFGLGHVTPMQVVPSLIVGLVLGTVYARTGSFWLCAFGHAAGNGTSFALGMLLRSDSGALDAGDMGAVLEHARDPAWMAARLVLLAVALAWLVYALRQWPLSRRPIWRADASTRHGGATTGRTALGR